MTIKEFERLRIFLKQHTASQVAYESVYVILHNAEADKASRYSLEGQTIRYSTSHQMDYKTLKIEDDKLLGRPQTWKRKAEKLISFERIFEILIYQ